MRFAMAHGSTCVMQQWMGGRLRSAARVGVPRSAFCLPACYGLMYQTRAGTAQPRALTRSPNMP